MAGTARLGLPAVSVIAVSVMRAIVTVMRAVVTVPVPVIAAPIGATALPAIANPSVAVPPASRFGGAGE